MTETDLAKLADDLALLARAADETIATLERMDAQGRPGREARALSARYAAGRRDALEYAAQQIHELLAPF
jgi:hypothetical protein